ncbi:MAG: peptidoglycan DD-metalloendopeptidase family protein [Bacteroides sp.]
MKRYLLLIMSICMVVALSAQSNKKIKELENKRVEIQKQIAQSETLLKTTKKDVGSQLSGLALLNGQIVERKKYIAVIEKDVCSLEDELSSLQQELNELRRDLLDKKKKYEASVQYMYKNKSIEEKLMFIFSAQSLSQTYRRLRYVREYATFQRIQGEEILKRQKQVERKRAELQLVKGAKTNLLKEGEREKIKLEEQEKQKKNIVAGLQKKQKGLQSTIRKKRKESTRLNAQIDRLIEIEIAKARKRAEEEARREAEAARKAEAARNKAENKSSSTSESKKKAAPIERYSMNKADRQLSGSFERNKGLLPVPISGSYIIVSHYGEYAVEGLRNVKLDNKGIDIQGKPGAKARAIFDGEVSYVFQYNGLVGVLVRHGNYISVYCNLSSASVSRGDKVKTKDTIGSIYSDPNGSTVLHFQLRKETSKLNPESWIDR